MCDVVDFSIKFSPFQTNNTAQLITEATVHIEDEILWTEQIIIDVLESTNADQIQEILKQRTSGFAARVNAILIAKHYEGKIPHL